LKLRFFAHPHPLGRSADIADDRLAALAHVDVLNDYLLLAAASVSLQRLNLGYECARKLVKGALRRILLRDVLDMGVAAGKRH
jgi:hypothetical protein